MYSTLRPGASSGLHTHENNCEVVYVISGEATFHYDGQMETVRVGAVPLLSDGAFALYGEFDRPRCRLSRNCGRAPLRQ